MMEYKVIAKDGRAKRAEMIIVSSDVLRRCMPINLVVLFGIINIAVIEIRIYYRRANEIY